MLFATRPGIILDTDLCTDPDDIADIAVCIALHKRGECDLLAVVTNCSNTKSAPCARALLDENGLTSTLVGAYQGADMDTSSPYTSQITTRFGNSSDTRANYGSGSDVIRQALAGRSRLNVRYINTGFAPNLQALLQSAGDGYSSLNGVDLFSQKVGACFIVGGDYPSAAGEYNFTHSKVSYNWFFANNPGRPVFLWGSTPPSTVATGPPGGADPLVSPVKYGYDLYGEATRPAWGQFGCLAAVRGIGTIFSVVGRNGTNSVNASTGANAWASTAGNDSYYGKIASDAALKSMLDGLIAEVL